MKCFHFTNGETKDKVQGGAVPRPQAAASSSSFSTKLYWARSLSGASSSSTASTLNGRSLRRSSEFEFDDLSSSSRSGFHEYLLLNHRQRREGNDDEDDDDDQLRVFTFAELKAGTRGFSRAYLIGEGGFGCVYRGVVRVPSGEKIEVAVKQLNRHGLQGHKEWINEVNLLGVIKHPNLVKLVGYCAEDDERGMQRLLVYELMKNKSLEDHLLSTSRVTLPTSTTTTTPLPWMTRLRIAQDAARGLAYLHEEMEFQLIFRDFKTSNILLDEDFNAKLSDFGLARLGPPEGLGHVSTCVVGTVGYAAPEYVQTGRLTVKSDVWSFGVVLYELITGRRALERNLPRAEQKLLEWVRPYVSDSKKFHLIVDPRLKSHYCMKSAQRVASLANKCLTKHPKSRPKMSEVVEMLGNIINEISPTEGGASHPVSATREVQEETKGEPEPMVEAPKQSSSHRKKGFDIREMVNLRNRSIGKLDWRNWTPGLVRTGS